MDNIECKYSEKENGWESERLMVTGTTWLVVELSKSGYVTIRKSEIESGEYLVAYVSDYGAKHRIRIYGHTGNVWIKIITSEKPKIIGYANI